MPIPSPVITPTFQMLPPRPMDDLSFFLSDALILRNLSGNIQDMIAGHRKSRKLSNVLFPTYDDPIRKPFVKSYPRPALDPFFDQRRYIKADEELWEIWGSLNRVLPLPTFID